MQLEFLWRDSSAFESELQERTGEPIQVTLTDNTSSIMSFKSAAKNRPARLRIHKMFLGADPEIIGALSIWLTRRKSPASAKLLDDFIRQNEHLISQRESRAIRLTTEGQYHEIKRHYDELNVQEFDSTITAGITWGKMPTVKRRRSIRLGSFTPEDNLIRIHPLLDQHFVPGYFVRYIIFHEMLHAYVGIETTPSGRRRIHSPEFNRQERAYRDYDKAIAWHDNPRNLRRLLRLPKKAA